MGKRPESVTQADIDRWEEDRQKIDNSERIALGIKIPSAEVFYAGEWLGEELQKLGCEEVVIRKICFACGQYQYQLAQDWEPAIQMLERYEKDGSYEEPGDTLGLKLIHMVLGPNPTKEEIIEYSCKHWGIKREDLPKLLFKFMVEGFPEAPSYVTDQKPKKV